MLLRTRGLRLPRSLRLPRHLTTRLRFLSSTPSSSGRSRPAAVLSALFGGVASGCLIAACTGDKYLTYADAMVAVTVATPAPVPAIAAEVCLHSTSLSSLASLLYSWWHDLLEGLRIVKRSAYLAFVFAPTIVTSPVLLFAGADSSLVAWWWKLARVTIRTSGPCNIKFSQWVATRPDLFPLVVCQQLQDLSTNAIRCSWEVTKSTLSLSFGADWADNLHLDIDPLTGSPLIVGSGCVAQVMRGHMKGDVEKMPIAVKVIHPHVAKSIKDDIRIMRFLCRVMERLPGLENMGLGESVEQFSTFMESQLDLTIEAASLTRFRKNFGCNDESPSVAAGKKGKDVTASSVTFPRPLYPYVSPLALVETFEEGELMLNMVDNMDTPTRNKIARMGLDAILKMVFQDNFIHADLHMGNIICKHLQGGGGGEYRMSMIDAGLVAQLVPQDRKNFVELFKAIVLNDGRLVGRLIMERSRNSGKCTNPERFESELESVVGAVHSSGLSLGRMGIGELLKRVLVACYENNVKLEPRFVTIVLAIGVVEGLGRRLDPDVDLLSTAAPHVLRAALTLERRDTETHHK